MIFKKLAVKKLLYSTILLCYFLFGFSQNLPNDCQNYIQACDNQSVSFDVSGFGMQEIIPESCSSSEHNSLWIRVTIDQPGTLGFTIVPENTNISEDYDFWVFGPPSTCANLGRPIRCSTTNPQAAGLTSNHTGLSATALDTSEGPGSNGDSFVRQLNVLAGQSYFVVVDRPIGSSPFVLNWSGTAIISNPFESANVNFPSFPNVTLCDEGSNNSEPYDFSVLDANYLSGITGFFLTYHANLQDASLNNNPITGSTNISQGTYYARINSINSQCSEIRPITVIFDTIVTNDVTKTVCENTPTNTITYDLSSHNDEVYTGSQVVTYTYYNSLVDATNSANPITNWQSRTLPVGLNSFYIRTEKGTCFDISELNITVIQRPAINPLVNLRQCDDDTDGFSAFNLTEANELIAANTTGLSFAYFLSLVDAQNNSNPITNDVAFVNQNVNTQTVYYRVSNSNDCARTGQLNLVVSATQVPATFQPLVYNSCDATFGTNNDAFATFDFSTALTTISNLFPAQLVNVTFYESESDALAETNAIMDISNYVNTTPNAQDIFVRVDSDLNNECVGFGKYVQLQVEATPIVSPLLKRECDDNNDGIFDFDTSTIENELLGGLSNVNVTYTDENNVVYTTLPNPFTTTNQVVTVIVTNNTTNSCSFTSTISFFVDSKPVVNPIDPNLLIKCDDELDPLEQDGIIAFDTATFENVIIGTQTNVTVEYYDENSNLLPDFIGTNFVTASQDITVKVINNDNVNCFSTAILSFVVYPLPAIFIQGYDEILCIDDPSDFVALNAGLVDEATISDFAYQWYLDNQIINGATQYNYNAVTMGDYTVAVTNVNNCISTRRIRVNPSDIATTISLEILDLIDSNTVIVAVTGNGNYQYSIDGENYQDSNVFYDVQPGELIVYVYDLNGCGIAKKTDSVLGVPNFFTPNGDGYNDYWNVKGFDEKFGKQTTISIFDRYGKLVKQISSSSDGWDGTFNGQKMPASDYWYTISLQDGRIKKGHFSLKR